MALMQNFRCIFKTFIRFSIVGSKMPMRKMRTRVRCYDNSTVKYVYTRCLQCSLGLYVHKSFRNIFVEDLVRVGSYLISRQLRL